MTNSIAYCNSPTPSHILILIAVLHCLNAFAKMFLDNFVSGMYVHGIDYVAYAICVNSHGKKER